MMMSEPLQIEPLPGTVAVAPRDFTTELVHEMGEGSVVYDRLVVSPHRHPALVWAEDVWLDAQRIRFASISAAAKALRRLGKCWSLFSVSHHRRAALIQQSLRGFQVQPLRFPEVPALPPIGAWALLDAHTLLAAPHRWKPVPHGRMEFEENKFFPPTRAYLKLWEILTLLGEFPKAGERCLDLGSSPGGWTWVLQSLGADVISVDKAGLDPKILGLPRITHLRESAFGLDPKSFGRVDWLCCDVICYPDKLYDMVRRWLAAGQCRNIICTVKLQGDADFAPIRRFQAIPGSQILHLYHNKHELTWVWPARKSLRQCG